MLRSVRPSNRPMVARSALLLAIALVPAVSACSDDDEQDAAPAEQDVGAELRRELLDMKDEDQAERTGEASGSAFDDRQRADRLQEIIDDHGWPTPDLVGDDGVSAAWVIAQHADHDVDFQEQVVELMRPAVERGDADPTELAFLEDRVATNRGQPQIYGTQGGCVDGKAEPGPITDPERVEERRAEVGLEPLDEYLTRFDETCAAE